MNRIGSKAIVGLCACVVILAAVASAGGVLYRGDLTTFPFVTVRGEHVDILTGGVYRFNGKNIAAEGVGWDAVTLFLVVPALALTLPGLWKESLRAKLIAMGLLSYFLYQYLEYAAFLAYGPLFLVYVLTFALSLSGIAMLAGGIDLAGLPGRFSNRFPRRSMVALGLFMAGLLSAMWLPLIAATFHGDVSGKLYGATTFVVQAFDLGFLVPLGLFTAVTVYRRLPVGYLLSSLVVVKAVAMATAICAMLIFEYVATGALPIGPLAIFALTAIGSGVLAVKVYSSIEPGRVERDLPDALHA